MPTDPALLRHLIEIELSSLSDNRVLQHIRTYLVEPTPVLQNWDYGKPGQQYVCWTVLDHQPSDQGIAYCEEGFGPLNPWGLVRPAGGDDTSMGMDAGWYRSFLPAYFDSTPVTYLPIWRVFRSQGEGPGQAISDEGSWEETWQQVMALREEDPTAQYNCDTNSRFGL